MNKFLRFLIPKTARRLDEQQRIIESLEKDIVYLKSRLGEANSVTKQSVDNRSISKARNALTYTSPTRTSTVSSSYPITTSDYSSYSSAFDSSSSSYDSSSCCCD